MTYLGYPQAHRNKQFLYSFTFKLTSIDLTISFLFRFFAHFLKLCFLSFLSLFLSVWLLSPIAVDDIRCTGRGWEALFYSELVQAIQRYSVIELKSQRISIAYYRSITYKSFFTDLVFVFWLYIRRISGHRLVLPKLFFMSIVHFAFHYSNLS